MINYDKLEIQTWRTIYAMEKETNRPSFLKFFENISEKESWLGKFSFISNPLVSFSPTSEFIAQHFHEQRTQKTPTKEWTYNYFSCHQNYAFEFYALLPKSTPST